MFTMFTDRDGKYQLLALAESGFDPLSRTTRFMLTEEAHHMFVGEAGVERIVQRTAELMKQDKNEDARAQGGIPLDMIQRYLNLWFALSLDLFGGEVSSNAASFFADGLKGRYKEDSYADHTALNQHYKMTVPKEGALVEEDVPLRNAMNEVLRDAYVDDCQRGVDRWNKRLTEAGISGAPPASLQAVLPPHRDLRGHALRHRRQAALARGLGEPQGRVAAHRRRPRLRGHAPEAGHRGRKIANWLGKPARGIKGLPFEYEYVRLD
jgi:benzoyl-CoA 2,3-dioxygenase component B